MIAHEPDRVAAAVGMMPHVQAQPHPVRVGILEELFDLLGILDVTFGVRMED